MASTAETGSEWRTPCRAMDDADAEDEFEGCSLPPKVVGPVLGHVVLSVPFIMDAAVARAQLPRTNLVRVRWWGEDKPGSLFRPRLVSHDDGADVSGGARRQTARTRTNTAVPYSADVYGARSIRMRFPVCVPPERLVEYLRDMQVLTLDVVDRSTRRKYGKCVLPFQSLRQSIASNAQARQALSRLRRDQALVEIRPIETKATPAVLGYLVVNLDISWLGSESHADDDTSHLDLDEVASPLRNPSLSPALTSFSAMMRYRSERISPSGEDASVSSPSVSSNERSDPTLGKTTDTSPEGQTGIQRKEVAVFDRLKDILEKGKALQQSMERAAGDDGPYEFISPSAESNGTPYSSDANVAASDHAAIGGDCSDMARIKDWCTVSPKTNSSHDEDDDPRDQSARLQSPSPPLSPIVSQPSSPRHIDKGNAIESSRESPTRGVVYRTPRVRKSRTSLLSNLQLALMIDKAIGISLDQLPILRPSDHEMLNLDLCYVFPFNRLDVSGGSPRRRVRRRLRWVPHEKRASAVINHIGVVHFDTIPPTLVRRKYQLLVIEVWISSRRRQVGSQDNQRSLIGLTKLSLDQISSYCRHKSTTNLNDQPIPYFGFDGFVSIIDPRSGASVGSLRCRVALGTIEQMMTVTSVLNGVVKLQGIVRGRLRRKHLGIQYQSLLNLSNASSRDDCSQLGSNERNEGGVEEDFEVSEETSDEPLMPAMVWVDLALTAITKIAVVFREYAGHGNQELLDKSIVAIFFRTRICVGPETQRLDGYDSVFDDRLQMWFINWRSPVYYSPVNQLSSLELDTQLRIPIIVHEEWLDYIQQHPLEIELLTTGTTTGEGTKLATVHIPTAALTYRAGGIVGSFAVEVGDVPTGYLSVCMSLHRDPAELSRLPKNISKQIEEYCPATPIGIPSTDDNVVIGDKSQDVISGSMTLPDVAKRIHDSAQEIHERLQRLMDRHGDEAHSSKSDNFIEYVPTAQFKHPFRAASNETLSSIATTSTTTGRLNLDADVNVSRSNTDFEIETNVNMSVPTVAESASEGFGPSPIDASLNSLQSESDLVKDIEEQSSEGDVAKSAASPSHSVLSAQSSKEESKNNVGASQDSVLFGGIGIGNSPEMAADFDQVGEEEPLPSSEAFFPEFSLKSFGIEEIEISPISSPGPNGSLCSTPASSTASSRMHLRDIAGDCSADLACRSEVSESIDSGETSLLGPRQSEEWESPMQDGDCAARSDSSESVAPPAMAPMEQAQHNHGALKMEDTSPQSPAEIFGDGRSECAEESLAVGNNDCCIEAESSPTCIMIEENGDVQENHSLSADRGKQDVANEATEINLDDVGNDTYAENVSTIAVEEPGQVGSELSATDTKHDKLELMRTSDGDSAIEENELTCKCGSPLPICNRHDNVEEDSRSAVPHGSDQTETETDGYSRQQVQSREYSRNCAIDGSESSESEEKISPSTSSSGATAEIVGDLLKTSKTSCQDGASDASDRCGLPPSVETAKQPQIDGNTEDDSELDGQIGFAVTSLKEEINELPVITPSLATINIILSSPWSDSTHGTASTKSTQDSATQCDLIGLNEPSAYTELKSESCSGRDCLNSEVLKHDRSASFPDRFDEVAIQCNLEKLSDTRPMPETRGSLNPTTTHKPSETSSTKGFVHDAVADSQTTASKSSANHHETKLTIKELASLPSAQQSPRERQRIIQRPTVSSISSVEGLRTTLAASLDKFDSAFRLLNEIRHSQEQQQYHTGRRVLQSEQPDAISLSASAQSRFQAKAVTLQTPAPSASRQPFRSTRAMQFETSFKHDSETERIARIMQGKFAYWTQDGGSDNEANSSEDEKNVDSDDDYFF